MSLHWLRLLMGGLLAVPMAAAPAIAEPPATQPAIVRDFWSPDAAVWGDRGPSVKPDRQHLPHGFRCDYAIDVPAAGWYELFLAGAGEGFRHDVFVDGQPQWRYVSTDTADKAGNLWLAAGRRTIRIQRLGRVGYPLRVFDRLELRPAAGRAEASMQARKVGVDVVRVGEPLRIELAGGVPDRPTTYELLRTNQLPGQTDSSLVQTVTFPPADQPQTKAIEIQCPAEGVFTLTARSGSKPLTGADFQIGSYAVVDVKHVAPASGQLQLVQDIDCVHQTLNGRPLPAGMFVECNGLTRISHTAAGAYRESHDGTPPFAPVPATAVQEPVAFSGFSYKLDLPEVQTPYLVEIEYPDDARRSVTISLNGLDPATGELLKGSGYNGKSYETGGMFPLTNRTAMHRAVLWPKSKSLLIGILSQSIGYRAAASRVRVYRFADGHLPPAPQGKPGGRNFIHWYEEARSWRHLVNVTAAPDGIVHDFIGFDRWAQLARYYGASGISSMGVGYQDAFWRCTTLDGMLPADYDACRLLGLCCEKYGLKFMPEIYYSQWYLENRTFPEAVGNDQDFRAISCHGATWGNNASPCTLNPLHPVVQQTWINAIGEMADKLRDSPAFAGISVRSDAWGIRGEFLFPSLHWGYGDWTVNQFATERNVTLPTGDDADRFTRQYEFLTTDPMRQQWIDWRCAKLLDYHQRLLSRLRGDRKDLAFVIAGAFDAEPVYKLDDSINDRALGSGVDLAARTTIDGLSIMPVARYGSRTTTAADRAIYDGFFDADLVATGNGHPRAFGAYMNYHELATYWPAAGLGIVMPKGAKPFYYCSAVLASGRHSLEKYAVVLASQDTSLFRDGGNADIYGDPAIWGPWLAEYKSLPAEPFEPHQQATDPVAVWTKSRDDGFYFYAVNREAVTIRVTLTLSGAASLTRLGTGQSITTAGNGLELTLEPYDLQAFVAPRGATIRSITTHTPVELLDAVRARLAFAGDLLQQFRTSRAGALTDHELTGFAATLAEAQKQLDAGHCWRARALLSQASMMRAYGKAGSQPPGQIVTQFPGLLTPIARGGHWNLVEPVIGADQLVAAVPADQRPRLQSSTGFNPEWTGTNVATEERGHLTLPLTIPADGSYVIHLGHVARGPGVGSAFIDDMPLGAIRTGQANEPETTVFVPVRLKQGVGKLRLTHPASIGVYGLKLLPQLSPMPNAHWLVAGPFPAVAVKPNDGDANAKATLDRHYPPESPFDPSAVFSTDDGRSLRWCWPTGIARGLLWDRGVDMSIRTHSASGDVNFAVTHIDSDRERTALLYLAAEWWARAYLNGERLTSDIDPKLRDECGADFNTFYPTFRAVLKLRAGENVLMIKQHGGTLGSAFAAFITKDDDIRVTIDPQR